MNEAPVTRGVKSHPLMTMILSTLSHELHRYRPQTISAT